MLGVKPIIFLFPLPTLSCTILIIECLYMSFLIEYDGTKITYKKRQKVEHSKKNRLEEEIRKQ